jgi:hypothetical protein
MSEIPNRVDQTLRQSKAKQCRSQHIEATEFLRKRANRSGERGEVIAAASLSFKNTMPVGSIMIFGWP